MFGSIGGAELVLILVLALLLFGPRKLPQIGRSLGKSLSEFRKATTDFKMNLEREVQLDEVKDAGREITRTVDDVRNLSVAREPDGSGDRAGRAAGEESPDRATTPSGRSDSSSPDGTSNRPS